MTENSGHGHAVSILFLLISSIDMGEIPDMYMYMGYGLLFKPLLFKPLIF